MTDAHVLVFAYGSNLCSTRLRARTPSARVVARGELAGHDLRWHKRGRDGSGKCDALHTGAPHDVVWGAVYALDPAELSALDTAESLGAGYDAHELEIHTERGPLRARTYRATLLDPSLAPYCWYKAYVLAGAREHGLPAAYLARLERVPARDDPDRARAARHAAVLATC